MGFYELKAEYASHKQIIPKIEISENCKTYIIQIDLPTCEIDNNGWCTKCQKRNKVVPSVLGFGKESENKRFYFKGCESNCFRWYCRRCKIEF